MRRLGFMSVVGLAAVSVGALISAQTVTPQTPAGAGARPVMAAANRLLGGPHGAVKNPRGFPVEGLMVQLISQQSSIRTTVYTNQLGKYEFPRLETGDYVLRLARPMEFRQYRKDSVRVDGATALPDIVVEKVSNTAYLPPTADILPQLTGSEWLFNMPGTEQEKDAVVTTCGGSCHSYQNQMRGRYSEADWRKIVHRMSNYGNRTLVPPPPPGRGFTFTHDQELVIGFLSRVRGLDAVDPPLKTFPRPIGAATRAIVTEYELPWTTVNIHDVAGDAQGNIWFNINRSPFLGKLDPKTGKVTSYRVPAPPPMKIKTPRFPMKEEPGVHPGLHWIQVDQKTGTVWFTDTWSQSLGRLDPRTGDIQLVNTGLVGNVALSPDGQSIWRHDGPMIKKYDTATVMKTGLPVKEYALAKGASGTYGNFISRDGRFFAGGATRGVLWLDIQTGEIRDVPVPSGKLVYGRGDFDPAGNVWVGAKTGMLVKYDPKTNVISEYVSPTPYVAYYTARADDNGEIWAGDMHGGRVARFNPKSEQWIEYVLPTPWSQDFHSWIDNSTTPVSYWYGDQFGYIVRVQPLE
jgi:virginiamycin B lyase